jgi:hypothetical protein
VPDLHIPGPPPEEAGIEEIIEDASGVVAPE